MKKNVDSRSNGGVKTSISDRPLSYSATQPQYPQAEYDRAKVVLMHEPQEELSLGTLHPDAALFKSYLAPAKAQREHQAYQQILRDLGLEVFTIREILLAGCVDDHQHWIECDQTAQLRKFALDSIRFTSSEISQEEIESHRQILIQQYTPNDLMRILFLRPEVRFRKTEINTGVTAEYIMRPLMNLFFMRDQVITTSRGIVVCRMNSPQRQYECDLVEFCLRKLGRTPIYRIRGEGAYLEGGDFLLFRNFAMINCGLRTTESAIHQLMTHDLIGKDRVVVVHDRLKSQAQMHLDSYCNVVDESLMTLCSNRYYARPQDEDFLMVEIYERTIDGYLSRRKLPFMDFLREQGIRVLPISPEDEESFANNYLCIEGRELVAVAGQSLEFQTSLKEFEVKVHWAELTNLTYGYGAAHCMTQVIERYPPDKARPTKHLSRLPKIIDRLPKSPK